MEKFMIIARILAVLPGLIRMADEAIPGPQRGLEKLALVIEWILELVPEASRFEAIIKRLIAIFISGQKAAATTAPPQ
jgi:hypothetical protein